MKRGIRVVVYGGRHWNDRDTVWRSLDIIHAARVIVEVIEGGAPGADSFAREWADANVVARTTMPANWKKHGRSAGPIRNRQMGDLKPDLGIEFPGGAGTANMRSVLDSRGIPVMEPMAEEPESVQ